MAQVEEGCMSLDTLGVVLGDWMTVAEVDYQNLKEALSSDFSDEEKIQRVVYLIQGLNDVIQVLKWSIERNEYLQSGLFG